MLGFLLEAPDLFLGKQVSKGRVVQEALHRYNQPYEKSPTVLPLLPR
jgi:hypothetical protein